MISKSDEDVSAVVFRTAGGWCWIAGRGSQLKGTSLPHSTRKKARASLMSAFPNHEVDSGFLPELVASLESFFKGEPVAFKVRLDWGRVTEFQKDIYQALRRVRYGQLLTYGELATRAGRKGTARGVGVAMAHNPFAPVVPCHRVLASGGALGGFSSAGGLEQKRSLLKLEGHELKGARVLTSSDSGC